MSLLSALAELFEIIIFKQIINISSLIHNLDSVPNTILHQIIDKIASSFVHQKCYPGVILDVSQAFNKVWHTILLFKLKKDFPNSTVFTGSILFFKLYFFLLGKDFHFCHSLTMQESPRVVPFTIPLKCVHFRHS